MATGISWCDETINPVVGCNKISSGCKNCYAEPMAQRLAAMGTKGYEGTNGAIIRNKVWTGNTSFIPSALDKPYGWKKSRSIFVGSMGDLFHESVRMEWIEQIIGMIASNPRHTFILLTKRPERMKSCLEKLDHGFFSALYQLQAGTAVDANNWPLPNLVLGTSVENQQAADERIPLLLSNPAAKRFISLEPMIGAVDLAPYLHGGLFADPSEIGKFSPPLDGVILGGESGHNGRRMEHQWVMDVRDQCRRAHVPFMFKQWYYENRNEVDPDTGFPWLGDRIHTDLAWAVRKPFSTIGETP